MSRLFIGGLPISNTLQKKELLAVVGKFSKDVEIIRDAEGNQEHWFVLLI